MARPLRIEFDGAWYHVMNRGAGRRAVFREPGHYELFLALLAQIGERFGVETHAYCLMGNHYHLLLHTPHGGLGRGMRHLDGLYTQRLNRLLGTDGPLFRGRYKAILVDADSYLTQVSRYVHRNPLEAGLVKRLSDYRWSSYPCYVGARRGPDWLNRDAVLEAVGGPQAYRRFGEADGDDTAAEALDRRHRDPVLGSDAFRARVERGLRPSARAVPAARRVRAAVPIERIVDAVAVAFRIEAKQLQSGGRPRGEVTTARDAALWIGQQQGRLGLRELAESFGLGHITSVSGAIGRLKARMSADPAVARKVRGAVAACLNDNK